MRYFVLLLSSFLLCLELCSVAVAAPKEHRQQIFSMQDCVVRALENNPKIRAAEEEVFKAETQIGRARAGFFPRLSAFRTRKKTLGLYTKGTSDNDYDDQTVSTHGLQLSQRLFAGLQGINNYDRAVLAHQYTLAEKKQTVAALIFSVQNTFLEYQDARAQVDMYTAYAASLQTDVEAAQAMFKHQLIPYSSVLDAKTALVSTQQRLSEARNQVQQKSTELKAQLNIPFENEAVFTNAPWRTASMPLPTLEEIQAKTKQNNPQVRLARLALGIVKKDKNIILGSFFPTLTFTAAYTRHHVDYEDEAISYRRKYDRDYTKEYATMALNLEWQFFSGGDDYYRLQNAKHEIRRVQANLEDQETQAYTEACKAYSALSEARTRAGQAFTLLQSARENLEMQSARLQKKLGTVQEMMLARSKFQEARAALLKAETDCQKALARLNYTTGVHTYSLDQKELP